MTKRSIARTFRGDGMLLHCGGEHVVTRARPGLRGQLIGTEFCHRRRFSLFSPPVRAHRVTMVKAPPRTRLVRRFRTTPSRVPAVLAAVDVSAVAGLTDVPNGPAPGASNLDQNLDVIHARTTAGALIKLAPLGRLRAPSLRQRPRATEGNRPLDYRLTSAADPRFSSRHGKESDWGGLGRADRALAS